MVAIPKQLIYPVGGTQACRFAAEALRRAGAAVIDHPSPEVTALLLDVPSFRSGTVLRSGEALSAHLERVPPTVTVIGGALGGKIPTHRTLDLLEDPDYLARNAAVTASCALQLAAMRLPTALPQTETLVIGWGRIGKCLAQQLRGLGVAPIVAVRKPSDRAMLRALGYRAADTAALAPQLKRVRLIFNTVPAPVLSESDCTGALKLDLASVPGMAGEDVIAARGLPGIYAPESSGELIADTVLRLTGGAA